MSRCSTNYGERPERPNLLLSTSYALNRSNSKRACIGLVYERGHFYEAVKLVSSGGDNKSISLDRPSWQNFKDQFKIIAAYFDYNYDFYREYGNPHKLYLLKHDLEFTSSYGNKSICIDERPPTSDTPELDEDEDFPPPNQEALKKKRKYSNHPCIVMQETTFEGLQEYSVLLELHFDMLKEVVGKINRSMELIYDFLKQKMDEMDPYTRAALLKEPHSFKQYYSTHSNDIEAFVAVNYVKDEDFKNKYLKIALGEILVSYVNVIQNYMKNLYKD